MSLFPKKVEYPFKVIHTTPTDVTNTRKPTEVTH